MIKQSIYPERDQRRGGLRLGERLEELLVGILVLEARSLPGLHGLLLTLREDKFLGVAWPGAGTAVADPHHDGELRTTGRPELTCPALLPLSLTSSALSPVPVSQAGEGKLSGKTALCLSVLHLSLGLGLTNISSELRPDVSQQVRAAFIDPNNQQGDGYFRSKLSHRPCQ